MNRIVVVGDLNLDIHAQMPSDLTPGCEIREPVVIRAGGSAGTFARTAAALGADVVFIGAVGRDLVGDLLETSLVQAHVAPKLNRSSLASGAVLALQMDHERSMVCSRGANDGLTEEWVSQSLPRNAEHLHISGYAMLSTTQRCAALRALALAADHGMSQSLDPPPASLLRTFGVQRFLDLLPSNIWLFPNRSEGHLLSHTTEDRDALEALKERCPVGALTLGADGAWAWDKAGCHFQASPLLPPVDTTGAGDVYAATYVTRYLQRADVEQANRDACAAAASMLRERLSCLS